MTFLNINTAAFTYQIFKEEIFFFKEDNYFILEFIDLKKKSNWLLSEYKYSLFLCQTNGFHKCSAWFNDSLIVASA